MNIFRDIVQFLADAIGGLLFIIAAVLAFAYLPGFIYDAVIAWANGAF